MPSIASLIRRIGTLRRRGEKTEGTGEALPDSAEGNRSALERPPARRPPPSPKSRAAPGTRALFDGLPAADPATPNQMNNKKLWPTAQASLSTADKRVVLGDCVLAADRAVASVDVGDGASVG